GYWQTIEKDYHWHIEIIPRLVKQGGFEWGTGFYINPTPPEEAADFLKSLNV
ncbi:MAG: galactose-1-phosphate uridylyltransferase, partial [Candidatus Omnitrophica bacterium]|nr:galactose-1-phosphate uridylyltransferase [Candidatus Omnitrophota bacterium]